MRKIFKYPIEPKDTVQTAMLPRGAEIVALRTQVVGDPEQFEQLFFWAIVNPAAPTAPRRLMCVGTGWEILPNIEEHIDTTVTKSGFVWHLLEVK